MPTDPMPSYPIWPPSARCLRRFGLALFSLGLVLGLGFWPPARTALSNGTRAIAAVWQHLDYKVQLLFLAPVITGLVNAVWFWASVGQRRLLHWLGAKSTVYTVVFCRATSRDRFAEIADLITGFGCLLIRYGSDDYLKALASDQEKYEGRLKNKILPIETAHDPSGNVSFTLRLPIHRRLGTQFKCFVNVKDESGMDKVLDFLNSSDVVSDAGPSHGVKANRIYFLVKRFAVVETPEHNRNNMVYPE